MQIVVKLEKRPALLSDKEIAQLIVDTLSVSRWPNIEHIEIDGVLYQPTAKVSRNDT